MSTSLPTPFKIPINTASKSIVAVTLMSSCLFIISACDSQKITSASTVGSNNIAQTEPDIINRNSMQDVTKANTDSEDSHSNNNDSQNSSNENSDGPNPNVKQ